MPDTRQPTVVAVAAVMAAALAAAGCSGDDEVLVPAATGGETAAAADTPFPTSDADKLALLIGVGSYPEQLAGRWDSLRGTENDIRIVRELLVRRFGFPEGNVRVVQNEAATLEGIVRAFDEHLLRQAGAGTEVVVYYSGHGSQVLDVTGLEPDSRDSSLVAHDSRIDGRRGAFDLSDDALYSMLRELTAHRGARVTVLTDSCHSGGTVRGGRGGRVGARRFAPAGAASVRDVSHWSFWPEGVPFLDDDARRGLTELDHYVHIAACASTETAYEYDYSGAGGPVRFHGIMTMSLVTALRGARPGDTFRAIARRTAALMKAVPDAPPQTMWVEGDLDRELFSARFAAPPDGFEVTRGDGSRLTVAAGFLHGLAEGAILDVVDGKGRQLGALACQEVAFDVTRAGWVDEPAALPAGTYLLARLRSLPRDMPRLRVRAADEELAAALAESQWAAVRADGARACDYVLEHAGSGSALRLLTCEGIPLAEVPVAELEGELRKEVQFRSLWAMANPALRGELHALELEFVLPEEDELVDARAGGARFEPAAVAPLGAGTDRGESAAPAYAVQVPSYEQQEASARRHLGVLQITNQTLETVYVQVLSLSENREINVVWPLEGARDRPIDQDAEPRRIPIWLGSPSAAEWPLARPMCDRYLVIATRRPVDFHAFARGRTAASRGSAETMPGVLQSVFATGLSRGGGQVEKPDRGWGVAWVDLSVRGQ